MTPFLPLYRLQSPFLRLVAGSQEYTETMTSLLSDYGILRLNMSANRRWSLGIGSWELQHCAFPVFLTILLHIDDTSTQASPVHRFQSDHFDFALTIHQSGLDIDLSRESGFCLPVLSSVSLLNSSLTKRARMIFYKL